MGRTRFGTRSRPRRTRRIAAPDEGGGALGSRQTPRNRKERNRMNELKNIVVGLDLTADGKDVSPVGRRAVRQARRFFTQQLRRRRLRQQRKQRSPSKYRRVLANRWQARVKPRSPLPPRAPRRRHRQPTHFTQILLLLAPASRLVFSHHRPRQQRTHHRTQRNR